MPSYVIVSGFNRNGETVEATLCAPGALGFPDRKTSVPVRVQHLSEQALSIDGVRHAIISSLAENGVTIFLINGSIKGLRNRERRAALARASQSLQQLSTNLMALTAESEEPGFVAGNL